MNSRPGHVAGIPDSHVRRVGDKAGLARLVRGPPCEFGRVDRARTGRGYRDPAAYAFRQGPDDAFHILVVQDADDRNAYRRLLPAQARRQGAGRGGIMCNVEQPLLLPPNRLHTAGKVVRSASHPCVLKCVMPPAECGVSVNRIGGE